MFHVLNYPHNVLAGVVEHGSFISQAHLNRINIALYFCSLFIYRMTSEQTNENKPINVSRMIITYAQCEETKESLQEHLKTLRNYACSLIARESHHETEGHHLHAFVRFSPAYKSRYNALATSLILNGHRADIRFLKTQKDILDAIKYVQKDGDILNDGVELNATRKSRIYSCKEILTRNIEELVDEGAIAPGQYMSIVRAQAHYRLLVQPNPDLADVRGIWLHGPAGSGKSYAARMIGGQSLYLKSQNKWWDGYQGEETVLIDDLDTMVLSHYLKIWADRWACTGEIKGATIKLPFKRIIVTSNYSIAELMDKEHINDEALFEALHRRFVQHRIASHEDSDRIIALYTTSENSQPQTPEEESHDESHINLFASTSPSGFE